MTIANQHMYIHGAHVDCILRFCNLSQKHFTLVVNLYFVHLFADFRDMFIDRE